MSFHACGGNVGDNAQIPLPQWVLQVGRGGREHVRMGWFGWGCDRDGPLLCRML